MEIRNAMKTANACDRPIVFFDGGCPLCRREITHYQGLDTAALIEWVDIHAQPAALQPYNLSPATAMQRMHLRETDGRVVTGAYAFAALWRRLPYYRWLAALASVPGVLPLLDRLYSVFARWRWKRRCGEVCQ